MNRIFIGLSNVVTGVVVYKYITKQDNTFLDNKDYIKNDVAGKTYKTYTKFVSEEYDASNINVYENEKKWLIKMKDSLYTSKLLYYNDKHRMLVTIDVGNRVTKETLPPNYNEQLNNILEELDYYNCRHNDIKPAEIIEKNSKLKLVDFGWAHKKNKDNPSNWPKYLGDKYKCEPYNDKCSFDKCIKDIMNK